MQRADLPAGEQQQAAAGAAVARAPGLAAKKKALAEFTEEWEHVPEQEDTNEVQVYLRFCLNVDGDGRDVLRWWKQHETMLPLLSRLTCIVLSVPASCTGSKHTFSSNGRITEEIRTVLKPASVDAVLFLHNALD